MKVTNWRRKLMASLAAGGLVAPTVVSAANLDTNLLLNPGFENVSFASTGGYGGPSILSWTAGTRLGFAYSHNLTNNIPDFANGRPLSGGGNWYFTSNSGPNGSTIDDADTPGEVAQLVTVSGGATGTQIATGETVAKLSGFFSGYLANGDYGHLHVEYLNGSNASLGSTEITNQGVTDTWRQRSGLGLVPVGTATLRVSVFGTPLAGGPDGYIDNVDVQLTAAANELLFLQVNTTNGQVSIRNQTGDPVNIDYYEITSATGSLNATSWNSLQEQNLAGFPAGNGSGNGWEQFGGSSSNVIGESYLTGDSDVVNNATIGIGAAFRPGFAQNLVFRYGALAAALPGDFNGDGAVNAADYPVWRKTIGTQSAYDTWRANFGATGGGAAVPSTLFTGFVRYVTSGAGTASTVPEPSTVLLVGLGLASLAVGGRRKTTEN